MTEDEALTKWCPFYRMAGAGDFEGTEFEDNRPENIPVDERSLCIGSACMAWRKRDAIEQAGILIMHEYGFCGLAGQP